MPSRTFFLTLSTMICFSDKFQQSHFFFYKSQELAGFSYCLKRICPICNCGIKTHGKILLLENLLKIFVYIDLCLTTRLSSFLVKIIVFLLCLLSLYFIFGYVQWPYRVLQFWQWERFCSSRSQQPPTSDENYSREKWIRNTNQIVLYPQVQLQLYRSEMIQKTLF